MFDRQIFDALSRRHFQEASRPIFPLPVVGGCPPIVLLFDHQDRGLDIAYERDPDPDTTRVRLATRESTLFWIPTLVPVFAIGDGRIIHAEQQTDASFAMLVEHDDGWISSYARMRHMLAFPTKHHRREDRVAAGNVIGFVGPPVREGPLEPLRFELWRADDDLDLWQVDPLPTIHRWRVLRRDDVEATAKPAQVQTL